MGVLECHQSTPLNKMVELKNLRMQKLAVSLLWREVFITTGKKRYITTGKKKYTVVCLMAAPFWQLRPEKKDTFVCLLGARFWRLRPEKKRYSRLSDGCAVLAITTGKKKDTVVCWREIGSFFVVAGNFHYDRKKKIHYDRKKKIQSSV